MSRKSLCIGTTFGAALFPILPWVAAIAGVTVAGIALHKHFSQECIPTVKLFGEETAEGTKKAVGTYMELDKSVEQSLMNLKLTGATVSAETKDTLVNNFSQMGEQIKTGMDQQFNESFASLQTFFTNSTALTQEEEQNILEGAKAKNEAEKAEITAHTQRIQEILNAASAKGRELTAQEMQEINSLQQQMKVNAVQSLSETEVESKAILERMKQQAGEMTAQQAVEVVKNSSEQKNKAVENANAQYDESIKAIIRQRDESGTISAEQAKKLIADAKLQRDESITCATEMHNGVIEQAKKQAGDHVSQVDWEKGEVKTKWTQMLDETTAKINAYTEHRKQMWKNLGTATKELCVEIKQGIVDVFTELPEKNAELIFLVRANWCYFNHNGRKA